MKVITLANMKGGVGKSSSATALSAIVQLSMIGDTFSQKNIM